MPCLVDVCTGTFKRSVDENRAFGPSSTVEHCLLLKSYRQCLNDTFRHCLTQLDFHSAATSATRQWHKFECHRLLTLSKSTDQTEHRISVADGQMKCPLMSNFDGREAAENEVDSSTAVDEEYYYSEEENDVNHRQRSDGKRPLFCAIFGQLHLRPFHGLSLSQIDQCAFAGARPLIDHPFFLVQITASDLLANDSKTTDQSNQTKLFGITKVAVIIRPKKGCVNDRKVYLAEASADQQNDALPATFADGSSETGAILSGKRAVEIVRSTKETAKISLNHIDTQISITSIGNLFFNVFVRLRSPKIENAFQSSLCVQNCPDGLKMDEYSAFLNSNKEIRELCSKILDELTVKNGEEKSANRRHNWISAICEKDLAKASAAKTTKNAFPTTHWLNSLIYAATEIEIASVNGQFYNTSRQTIDKIFDGDPLSKNDKVSPFIDSGRLSDKKAINGHQNKAKDFEWLSHSKHKYFSSKAYDKSLSLSLPSLLIFLQICFIIYYVY
ncbi:hypothetical protein niasHS_015135 [Heterodera schachtii]|uniref:Uncharacterized protein n=1 Tax=Heterodera schachtii TaxID=97005 RepID=A0ABD2I9V4_HETSC